MAAPVYRIGLRIVRVCLDGWMFELPNAEARNFEGRELNALEREKVLDAIEGGTAHKLT